jgi:hypothetical protein
MEFDIGRKPARIDGPDSRLDFGEPMIGFHRPQLQIAISVDELLSQPENFLKCAVIVERIFELELVLC